MQETFILQSITIHCSFFSFLSPFKTLNMHLCLFVFFGTVVYAVARIVEPDFEGVNFAKALFGKDSIRYFKKQQWILKPLVRYSALKISVVCRTILAPQTRKASLFASCATLIGLQVMKTLYRTRSGFTEEWR